MTDNLAHLTRSELLLLRSRIDNEIASRGYNGDEGALIIFHDIVRLRLAKYNIPVSEKLQRVGKIRKRTENAKQACDSYIGKNSTGNLTRTQQICLYRAMVSIASDHLHRNRTEKWFLSHHWLLVSIHENIGSFIEKSFPGYACSGVNMLQVIMRSSNVR